MSLGTDAGSDGLPKMIFFQNDGIEYNTVRLELFFLQMLLKF